MSKGVAHGFHHQDMLTLAYIRKKRIEARVGMVMFFIIGVAIGTTLTDVRMRAELSQAYAEACR